MKYLALLIWFPVSAATVSITMDGNNGTVTPATTVTAQFHNFGNDTVSVVINGVDKGTLTYPYTTTYTSLATGSNNIVVTTCSYMGVTSTTTFTTISGRSFSRSPKR